MISCRTLGPIEVLVDDAPAPPELLWRKHLGLLIYLARSIPRARTRDHLIGLLWPDRPDTSARHSLNEAIRVLRRFTGEEGVASSGGQIRLLPGVVQLDLDELVRCTSEASWGTAATLIAGEFMEGFTLPGASTFEDWLAGEREHWRGQSVTALIHRADELERSGRVDDGASCAIRALQLDPRSERAVRTVMRCLSLAGDRTEALQRYDSFHARLVADLGAAPGGETTALADRIRQERSVRPPGAATDSARASEAGGRAPLVGREAELRALLDVATSCFRERRPAVLVVEGDTGAGKTRLVEELASRLRLEGVTVCLARAVEADREQSSGALLALARGALADAPGISGAQAGSIATLAELLPEWQARFPRPGDAGVPRPLAQALADVIRAAAEERPVLLAIDDAHWLDHDSALALSAIVRDLAEVPVALLLAVQPRWPRPELDELRARIGRDAGGLAVPLAPLGREALRSLARHLLADYTEIELDRVARRVSMDSAGLPLLAVELLRAVAVGLDLGSVSTAWPEPSRTLDQTLPGGLPDAVVAALRVTFRRLSPEAQRVLATAAAIGDRVDADQLSRATQLPLAEVTARLDELEWHQWLTADPRGYGFTARLVREVISRDMLTAGQRRRIQEAVAAR
jgi:DNA-binding SARP family transcriptional activator